MKLTIGISLPLRRIAFQLKRKTNSVNRFLCLLLALGLTTSFMPFTVFKNIAVPPTVFQYPLFAEAAEKFGVMSLNGLNKSRYTITELHSTSSDRSSWPRGINENGQVVGYAEFDTPTNTTEHRAVRWENGQPIDLQLPPPSEANGINRDGKIVGHAHFGNSDHAFRQDRGTVYDLGTFDRNGWGYSNARAINSSGSTVGLALATGPHEQAALWNPTITNLGSKLGTNVSESHATSINEKGQIVGDFLKNGTGLRHAFLLKDLNTLTDLGALDSSYNSYAEDINDNAQVVGYLYKSDAFLYDAATGMQHLKKLFPDTIESKAHAINMSGQIVGMSGKHACLWENGKIVDLNNEIPLNSGWVLSEAFDINDAGQIIGDGVVNGRLHGFLLTPDVPTLLTVNKVIRPSGDTGRFDLQIDGVTRAANISDGGSTGPWEVTAGRHVVGETAAPGTDSKNYFTSIDCGAGPVSAPRISITVTKGRGVTCTITNLGRPQLTVNKLLVPSDDPGLFNLQIDGSTKAANIGNGGTTGRQVVNRNGYHTVGETAGTNTNLKDYAITISCQAARDNRNGTASLLLAAGDDKICTIVNVGPTATCVDICTAQGGQRAACVTKCEQPQEQDCWREYQECLNETDRRGRHLQTKLFCFHSYKLCRGQIR